MTHIYKRKTSPCVSRHHPAHPQPSLGRTLLLLLAQWSQCSFQSKETGRVGTGRGGCSSPAQPSGRNLNGFGWQRTMGDGEWSAALTLDPLLRAGSCLCSGWPGRQGGEGSPDQSSDSSRTDQAAGAELNALIISN